MRFKRFLLMQLDRDDHIGDLAKDVRTYSECPRSNKILDWINHLRNRSACSEAIEALKDAWIEYEEYKITTKHNKGGSDA
jgi:hypothetical protein